MFQQPHEDCWKRFTKVKQFELGGSQKDEDEAFSLLSDLIGSDSN